MKNLVSFFLRRPLLVNLIVIAVFGLGIKSAFDAQKEGFPEISLNRVIITTIYPGASARDVELNVTTTIEEGLEEVENIQEITSLSEEGISTITVKVDENAEEELFEEVYDEINTAMAKISDLPAGIDGKPAIKKFTSKDIPIFELSFSGPYSSLKKFVPYVEKRLKKLEDIASIDVIGLPDDEIEILVDPLKAKKYMVDLRTIAGAIRKRNLEGSGGTLESFIDEKKIVFFSKYDKAEDVLNTNVIMSPDGYGIKLHQLATVSIKPEDRKLLVRNNGKRGVVLNIKKKKTADIIKMVDHIKKLLKGIDVPKDITMKFLLDQSDFTASRLNILIGNALIGFILVAIVLFLIFNIKTAFWTAFGIPFSLLGVMIFLKNTGISLNLISLGGFVVILGMLVDDAIVIAEEINSNKEKGMAPFDAATEAVKTMWVPVTGACLTTMIAFSPVFQVGGFPGKFVWVIPLMIIVALVISLFESYFILPAHLYHGKKIATEKKKFVIKLETIYKSLLIKILKRRYTVLLIAILIMAASLVTLKVAVIKDPFPQEAAEGFTIKSTFQKGSSQERTGSRVKIMEEALSKLPAHELIGFSSRIGTLSEQTGTDRGSQDNLAIIHVYLTKYSERERTAEEIMAWLKKKYGESKRLKEADIVFNLKRIGPPLGKPFEIRVTSNNDKSRYAAEKKIRDWLATIPGITDIENDEIQGKDEWNLKMDHDILARTGLTVEDVLTTLRIAFDGQVVSDMTTLEKTMNFRLRLNRQGRADPNFIRNLTIMNRYGNLIRLGEFVSYKEQPAMGGIRHVDGERTITIYGNTDIDIIGPVEVMQRVQKKFKSSSDVIISFSGQPVETKKIFSDLGSAAISALLGVFLIIALILNSPTRPVIIMLTIPFGIIGIVFALVTHNIPMSMLGGVAMVGLIGVMVNDSIVMVHTINSLMGDNGFNRDAVIEGAVSRLRPILLTTTTTFLGVMPTGYGIGGYDPFLSQMCIALGYGLLFATFIMLFLVPVFYVVGDDIKGILRGGS